MSVWSTVVETWHHTPSAVKTIVTAAFGTMIGAWLTSRSQEKRRVVEELKAIHAAHSLCISIVNRAMALKLQQVRPMKQRHEEAVQAFTAHKLSGRGPLELNLDLQSIGQLKFPGELLEKVVFDKCGLGGKGLAAVISLTGAIDDLRNSIEFRNDLIEQFRTKQSEMTELERIQWYVGGAGTGQIDNRFAHNLEAISKKTDDCIFFCKILSDELLERSDHLRARSWWKYRLGMPKLWPVDWTNATEADLIPAEDQYANWTSGFQPPPTMWERLRALFHAPSSASNTPDLGQAATRERAHVDVSRSPSDLGQPSARERKSAVDGTGYRRRSKGPHSHYVAKED